MIWQIRRAGNRPTLRFLAGIALAAMPVLGCTASSELETIQAQLSDVQLQVLQLQKQGPSKVEIEELEAALSDKIESLLRSTADSRTDLQTLAKQIEELETKLEDTNYRLQQLSQQIAATNTELQAVRDATEQARASVLTARQPAAAPTGPVDSKAQYDTAYNDYLQGNYDLAILGFRQYVESYRSTDLADNATYWLGECYYHQGKFQQAVDQFDAVLSQFEGSDRTASALLKKGYAYLELGQTAQGVVHLQNVICEHGATDEAALANQRLQQLGVDVEC